MQVGDTTENTCRSSDAVSNTSEGSIRERNIDNLGRTGIQIRSHQPREQQKSENSIVQGTAARRIRLRLNKKSSHVCDDEEATSELTEVSIITCTFLNVVSCCMLLSLLLTCWTSPFVG